MAPEEREQFILELKGALSSEYKHACLTEEEIQYVRLAIARQTQSIKLRQAIIEKTLTALLWAAIVGAGTIFMTWLQTHGWKT